MHRDTPYRFSRFLAGLALAFHLLAGTAMAQNNRALSQQFERILQVIDKPHALTLGIFPPMIITQAETNAYLHLHSRELLPPGVYSPDILLTREGIDASAQLNFDQIRADMPSHDWGDSVLAIVFHGTQPISFHVRLARQDDKHLLLIEHVVVGSTPIPDFMVQMALKSYVKPRYHVDLTQPFDLPEHVTRVEFDPGHIVFYRGEKVTH